MFDSPKQDFLIQRIEYLGDCQVLHLQFEEHEITAKTNGVTPVSDQSVKPGNRLGKSLLVRRNKPEQNSTVGKLS